MAQVTYQKCRCGDAVCKQYTLSTQGSVGFSLEDARLYAAASDLLEALQSAVASLEQFVKLNRIPENNKGLRDARAAIARATGDTP